MSLLSLWRRKGREERWLWQSHVASCCRTMTIRSHPHISSSGAPGPCGTCLLQINSFLKILKGFPLCAQNQTVLSATSGFFLSLFPVMVSSFKYWVQTPNIAECMAPRHLSAPAACVEICCPSSVCCHLRVGTSASSWVQHPRYLRHQRFLETPKISVVQKTNVMQSALWPASKLQQDSLLSVLYLWLLFPSLSRQLILCVNRSNRRERLSNEPRHLSLCFYFNLGLNLSQSFPLG